MLKPNKTIVEYRSRDSEASFNNAIKYAFKLLRYRDRSEKEMYERLIQKGFSEKIALEAVEYLTDKGFIDDKRFAEILKRDAVQRKYLGKQGVKSYLLNKGIDLQVVEDILGNEDDYLDVARNYVEKKLKNLKGYNDETIKKRLWGMLSRRGFSYDTIKKILKSFNLKEEEK